MGIIFKTSKNVWWYSAKFVSLYYRTLFSIQCTLFFQVPTHFFESLPQWKGQIWSCRCFHPNSKFCKSSVLHHEETFFQYLIVLVSKFGHWIPLWSKGKKKMHFLISLANTEHLEAPYIIFQQVSNLQNFKIKRSIRYLNILSFKIAVFLLTIIHVCNKVITKNILQLK